MVSSSGYDASGMPPIVPLHLVRIDDAQLGRSDQGQQIGFALQYPDAVSVAQLMFWPDVDQAIAMRRQREAAGLQLAVEPDWIDRVHGVSSLPWGIRCGRSST